MRGPLGLISGRDTAEEIRLTHGVVCKKAGRGREERKVVAVQPILPTKIPRVDNAVVPYDLGVRTNLGLQF